MAVCAMGFYGADAQTEVRYYTSKGNFDIRLTDTLTPRTVDSFIARVSEKFYDGLIFHRVINNFMIQGGDPLGTGMGGPGYTLPDEFHPTLKNVPGALAMANAGPNTSGCQFYINLVTNAYLNNHYTVFGMVTTGFTVVQAIGLVPTNSSDKPLTDVVIDSIRILRLYNPNAVGVNNVASMALTRIYPNPSKSVFNVDLPANLVSKIEMLNMAGVVVYSAQANGAAKIDIGHQPAGLYYVRIANANGIAEHRVVVQ